MNAEAIYAAEWRRINREWPDLLGLILAPDDGPRDLLKQGLPVHVSRRDAVIAASIIQWLGTNVGRGFVQGCERVVDEACRLRVEIGVKRANSRGREDTRTPLQRRKARLDAARKRLADATKC